MSVCFLCSTHTPQSLRIQLFYSKQRQCQKTFDLYKMFVETDFSNTLVPPCFASHIINCNIPVYEDKNNS